MDAIKHSPEGTMMYGILGVIGLTPPQIEQRLVDLFASKTSLVLTNVPGPAQPVYFAGTKVAGVIPWVPGGGTISLGVSLFSYNGTVTVAYAPTPASCPNPSRSSRPSSVTRRPRSAPAAVARAPLTITPGDQSTEQVGIKKSSNPS